MFSLYVTEYITPLECALIDWSYFECESQKHCLSWSRSGCICLFMIISLETDFKSQHQRDLYISIVWSLCMPYTVSYIVCTVLWCFVTKSKCVCNDFWFSVHVHVTIFNFYSLNFQNNSIGIDKYFQSFVNLRNSDETVNSSSLLNNCFKMKTEKKALIEIGASKIALHHWVSKSLFWLWKIK